MLVLFMVAMATVTTQAQTRDSVAFQPHWFVQPQVGVGYHVGEAKFSKLLSPTAQLSVGRQFSPVFGLRLGAVLAGLRPAPRCVGLAGSQLADTPRGRV